MLMFMMILSSICMLLFIPALILLIVFCVLNSSAKRKLRDYEVMQNTAMWGAYPPPVSPGDVPYYHPVPPATQGETPPRTY